jgi:transcriptional regulator with XRE-family HTH domain
MGLTAEQLAELRAASVGDSGNRVQTALDLLHLTQTACAGMLDMKVSYVADVARGRWQTITVENAHKFAELFGCAIEDIFPARTSDTPEQLEAHAE